MAVFRFGENEVSRARDAVKLQASRRPPSVVGVAATTVAQQRIFCTTRIVEQRCIDTPTGAMNVRLDQQRAVVPPDVEGCRCRCLCWKQPA